MGQSLILKRPLISEKSLEASAFGEYTFEVAKKATKKEIAKAVAKNFGVEVERVKTLIVKGRSRKAPKTRKKILLGAWKKAIVKIKEGQKIDLFETGGKEEGTKK